MQVYLREPITIIYSPNDTITGVNLKILRLSDGFWIDFSDLVFKNSGWTTDTAACSADSNNIWMYPWIVPQTEDKYQVIFIENTTNIQTTYPFIIDAKGHLLFTVISNESNSATTFMTDLTESVDDYFSSPLLVKFIDNNLKGQVKPIAKTSSYNGTTKFLTVSSAFTSPPSAGSKGIIISI